VRRVLLGHSPDTSKRVNFVDLDFAMIGPVVGDTSEVFDL
jgi:hypothetical protein